MIAYLTALLLLAGSLFMMLAGIGVFRLPDVLTRMQAASKAATLGVSCTFLAIALHFREVGAASRAVLVIGFVFLTAPVAAHLLGRSAMVLKVPLRPGTKREDLEAGYGSSPEPDAASDPEESPGD